MSYKSYKARVERRRALLGARLQEANQLRREAHLPIYDIDHEISQQEPLLTQDAWTQIGRERKAFAHFRKQQLIRANMPSPAKAGNWEEERAGIFRKAFVEHLMRTAWDSLMGRNPS